MTIGEKITELRKANGMTQEALGEMLGVSAQSVSKWENGVSMPDILLLPLIADTFDVAVDALYGRDTKPTPVHFEEAPDFLYDTLYDAYCHVWGDGCVRHGAMTADWLIGLREGLKDGMSSYFGSYERGATLLTKDFAVIFKGMDRAVFADEGLNPIFAMLADPDARKILVQIHDSARDTYTVGGMAKLCGVNAATVEATLETAAALGLLEKHDAYTEEDAPLTLYKRDVFACGKLAPLFMMIALAAQTVSCPGWYGIRGALKLIK